MGDSDRSETQQQLREIHKPVEYYDEMKRHLRVLESIASGVMVGYSDHDILFSKNTEVIEDDDLSLQEAQQSEDRLFSPQPTTKSKVHSLISPGPKSKGSTKGKAPQSATAKKTNKFTDEELPNLLKGVRLYGEVDKWGLIALEFFSHTNISSHNLEKAWAQFKQGKSLQELRKLLSQYDDCFDILPSMPIIAESSKIDRQAIRRQSMRNRQSSSIWLDDDDDDDKHNDNDDDDLINCTNTTIPLEPPGRSESIESVCRRVSMGLGLIENPYFDDDEDDNDEGHDCLDDNNVMSEEEHDDNEENDSFIVSDNEIEYEGGHDDDDYMDEDIAQSPPPRRHSLQFADNHDDDMDMRTASVHKTRRRKVVVDSDSDENDDEDEAMKTVERSPRYRLSSNNDDDQFEIEPFQNRLDILTEEGGNSVHSDTNDSHNDSADQQQEQAVVSNDQQLSTSYAKLIYQAREYELQNKLVEALSLYMQALEESDSDNKLHCKICVLAKQLNFY